MRKILYPASSMGKFDFETMYTMLGLGHFERKYTEIYLGHLLEIIGAFKEPFELIVKPHYKESGLLKSFIKSNNPHKVKVRLTDHKADIAKLEMECDLMVTVESTVLIEGIILDKPMIILDYPGILFSDWLTYPCWDYVRSKEQLAKAIKHCLYDSHHRLDLWKLRRMFGNYYYGKEVLNVA